MSSFSQFNFGIFCLNDVLIERSEIYELTFATMLYRFGIEYGLSQRYYRTTVGTSVREQFRTLLGKSLLEKEPGLLDELEAEYWESVTSVPTKLVQDAEDLLMDLRQRGIILFVSEAENEPEVLLMELGVDHYFSLLLGPLAAEEREKHIHSFANHVRLPVPQFCSSAFLVGATVEDIELAERMRIDSIGISAGIDGNLLSSAGAFDTVRRLSDLLGY